MKLQTLLDKKSYIIQAAQQLHFKDIRLFQGLHDDTKEMINLQLTPEDEVDSFDATLNAKLLQHYIESYIGCSASVVTPNMIESVYAHQINEKAISLHNQFADDAIKEQFGSDDFRFQAYQEQNTNDDEDDIAIKQMNKNAREARLKKHLDEKLLDPGLYREEKSPKDSLSTSVQEFVKGLNELPEDQFREVIEHLSIDRKKLLQTQIFNEDQQITHYQGPSLFQQKTK